jgi:hypothetical protein
MKFRPLLAFMPALLCLLIACAPPPNLRDSSWLADESLITDNPCSAPCWNNITPGVTHWDDAIALLEADRVGVVNLNIQTHENGLAKLATWQGSANTPQCCEMQTFDGVYVDIILLRLAPNVILSKLIEAKGEPTYALSQDMRQQFGNQQSTVTLIYPESGLLVYAFIEGTDAALSETSEIVFAMYYPPDMMDQLLSGQGLFLWKGYQPFSAYAGENVDLTMPIVTQEALLATAEATASMDTSASATAEATESTAPLP